AAAAAAAAG
ncbi:hypothetical protein CFC21_070121, partial [Triticum aestivum]